MWLVNLRCALIFAVMHWPRAIKDFPLAVRTSGKSRESRRQRDPTRRRSEDKARIKRRQRDDAGNRKAYVNFQPELDLTLNGVFTHNPGLLWESVHTRLDWSQTRLDRSPARIEQPDSKWGIHTQTRFALRKCSHSFRLISDSFRSISDSFRSISDSFRFISVRIHVHIHIQIALSEAGFPQGIIKCRAYDFCLLSFCVEWSGKSKLFNLNNRKLFINTATMLRLQ